ncbi:hypothetical protein B0O99DRAFT_627442 [Bisporella sp. PMI_857]|nr:hypothetical protein B0O99DRAFT_627442 [Bisporella sp. PMI_857]
MHHFGGVLDTNRMPSEVDKKEKDAKMLALTEELGFKHIILMVGEVKITELGKPKDRYKKKDFVATTFDLQIKGGKVESVQGKWRPSSVLTTFVKTTKKTDPQMKTIGLAFVKDKSYEYTIPGVNCDGYVKDMLANI